MFRMVCIEARATLRQHSLSDLQKRSIVRRFRNHDLSAVSEPNLNPYFGVLLEDLRKVDDVLSEGRQGISRFDEHRSFGVPHALRQKGRAVVRASVRIFHGVAELMLDEIAAR
ncbi:MAG TPA: hypothetical protein VEK79_09915 [Thermoanaerobaculia bacterium]|nr:hypothetical protein [Thermoanaerobaculia bacterium]